MKRDNILDAVVEAQNFIDRARELLEAWDHARIDCPGFAGLYPNREAEASRPKQSAALNRASMDLTRQLAKMRQER